MGMPAACSTWPQGQHVELIFCGSWVVTATCKAGHAGEERGLVFWVPFYDSRS